MDFPPTLDQERLTASVKSLCNDLDNCKLTVWAPHSHAPWGVRSGRVQRVRVAIAQRTPTCLVGSYELTTTTPDAMLAFVKVIESDLATISQESRRAVPAVKEAAEHALLELRRAQAGGPRDRLGWRTLVSQCLQPVYLACNHIDAPRALLVIAMSALQRAVVADALLSGEYLNVVRVLEIQAGSADDSMRLRVLQALPLVLAQVRSLANSGAYFACTFFALATFAALVRPRKSDLRRRAGPLLRLPC